MLLISMVLVMAAPSLSGFGHGRRTADAAGNILALTRLARTRAVAEACVYRLNIDTRELTYRLTRQEAGAFVKLEDEHGREFYLPEGVTVELEFPEGQLNVEVEEHISFIEFHPDGRCDEATIELRGPDGRVLQVACPSATERFRVMESPQELW
jgi:Tfp pilus assembly protein FimT